MLLFVPSASCNASSSSLSNTYTGDDALPLPERGMVLAKIKLDVRSPSFYVVVCDVFDLRFFPRLRVVVLYSSNMAAKQVFNFGAGPAKMPKAVCRPLYCSGVLEVYVY